MTHSVKKRVDTFLPKLRKKKPPTSVLNDCLISPPLNPNFGNFWAFWVVFSSFTQNIIFLVWPRLRPLFHTVWCDSIILVFIYFTKSVHKMGSSKIIHFPSKLIKRTRKRQRSQKFALLLQTVIEKTCQIDSGLKKNTKNQKKT